MTTITLNQTRPIAWSLPRLPRARIAAWLRQRGYPRLRRQRALAFNVWIDEYTRHQHRSLTR